MNVAISCGWIEATATAALAKAARSALSRAPSTALARQGAGSGGEIQLTDGIRELLKKEPVWGVIFRGKRYDCGTQPGWLAANIQLAMNHPELREVVLKAVDEMKL